MGVAGCGKSTVAAALAKHFNATLLEADDLHGPENIEKMRRGEALTDDDRLPWLLRVGEAIKASPPPVFISCSALRQAYRKSLVDNAQVPIGFIHLHTTREVIASRMGKRKGHFMPLSLLDSQFETLEPLGSEEAGVVVDIAHSKKQVVADAVVYIERAMQEANE